MRHYLFISKNGDSYPIAQRIIEEGHKVTFYNNELSSVGQGIINVPPIRAKLISPEGVINRGVVSLLLKPEPDCVVMDMVGKGFGKLAEELKHKFPLIGGSLWGEHIELDRPYGSKVMKLVGINTPPTFRFNDYSKAIRFVEEHPKAWVYKPSGNECTTTTYVSEDGDGMIGMLEYYAGEHDEFELQERVYGIEVSSELWFNGKDVVNVNYTMEEKRLMEGNLGPQTGCMGSAVWIGTQKSKLYREGVGKIVPSLRKVGYRGPIDLNTIITKDELYGLEWTARFGYDAIFVLFEMMKLPINELLYGVASGISLNVSFKSKCGIGVDLSVPPYPLDIKPKLYKGVLIQGLNKHNLKHIWLFDVRKDNNRFLAAGNGGDLMAITARGDEVNGYHPLRDAKRRVMRTIGNLEVPDVMYRRDIGDRVFKEQETLTRWGWL